MVYGYTSKEVGCGTQVPNPPLSRNCNWEDSAIIDHWETGKIGRKIAHKPGDFGIPDIV